MDEPAGRLRVAMVTDWFLPRQGGIELHLADLCRELSTRGTHPTVITTTPGRPESDAGIDVRRLAVRLAPGVDVAVSPTLVTRVRDALDRGQFDVVHAHVSVVSPTAGAAVLAARAGHLPLVVTFHSVLLHMVRVLRVIDRFSNWSHRPIVVSAVSAAVASQARRIADGLDVSVLPNGIDPARWQVSRRGARSGREVSVVGTMRLQRKKRPLALIEAFLAARADVGARGRRLTLRIAGDGPERRRLEACITRYGLQREVTLLGWQSRTALAELYGRADVFVLPATREAFGLAALEARCAGLPVIAMREAGAAEFLDHERTALLAADDAELGHHLARLALDDGLRARLAPPDPGLARYAWPSVIETHMACYRRAIALAATARTAGGRPPHEHESADGGRLQNL